MSFDGDADSILISTSSDSDAAPLYLTVASETDLGNVSDDDLGNRLSNLASLSDTMGHDDHLDYFSYFCNPYFEPFDCLEDIVISIAFDVTI